VSRLHSRDAEHRADDGCRTVRVALYHQKSKDFRLYHSFALEADGALDLTAIEELWGLDRVVVGLHRARKTCR
jgi:hypothetical protein